MTLVWIGDVVLIAVLLPVVVYLLRGVLNAARAVTPTVEAIVPVADRASEVLDAVQLLNPTKKLVKATVGVVAVYGGSLDKILEDA
jgi:hypothetical protein